MLDPPPTSGDELVQVIRKRLSLSDREPCGELVFVNDHVHVRDGSLIVAYSIDDDPMRVVPLLVHGVLLHGVLLHGVLRERVGILLRRDLLTLLACRNSRVLREEFTTVATLTPEVCRTPRPDTHHEGMDSADVIALKSAISYLTSRRGGTVRRVARGPAHHYRGFDPGHSDIRRGSGVRRRLLHLRHRGSLPSASLTMAAAVSSASAVRCA